MQMHFCSCFMYDELVLHMPFHTSDAYSNWEPLNEHKSVRKADEWSNSFVRWHATPRVVKTLELFNIRGHQIVGVYKMYHRDFLCHLRETVYRHGYHKGNRSSGFFEKKSSLQLLNDLGKVRFAVHQSLNKPKSSRSLMQSSYILISRYILIPSAHCKKDDSNMKRNISL